MDLQQEQISLLALCQAIGVDPAVVITDRLIDRHEKYDIDFGFRSEGSFQDIQLENYPDCVSEINLFLQPNYTNMEHIERFRKTLYILSVIKCHITTIQNVSSLHKLRVLMLSDNHIKDLRPLNGLPFLQRLYVEDNEIETYEGLDLPKLEVLHIQGNNLTTIPRGDGLPKLKELHLDRNTIMDFDEAVLSSYPVLKCLSICNNPIATIKTYYKLRNLPALKHLTTSDPVQGMNTIMDKKKILLKYFIPQLKTLNHQRLMNGQTISVAYKLNYYQNRCIEKKNDIMPSRALNSRLTKELRDIKQYISGSNDEQLLRDFNLLEWKKEKYIMNIDRTCLMKNELEHILEKDNAITGDNYRLLPDGVIQNEYNDWLFMRCINRYKTYKGIKQQYNVRTMYLLSVDTLEDDEIRRKGFKALLQEYFFQPLPDRPHFFVSDLSLLKDHYNILQCEIHLLDKTLYTFSDSGILEIHDNIVIKPLRLFPNTNKNVRPNKPIQELMEHYNTKFVMKLAQFRTKYKVDMAEFKDMCKRRRAIYEYISTGNIPNGSISDNLISSELQRLYGLYGSNIEKERGNILIVDRINGQVPGFAKAYFRGEITEEERYQFDAVTDLNLSNLFISEKPFSLSRFFPNLERLNLNFNMITNDTLAELGLSDLHNLSVLLLSNNQLTLLSKATIQNNKRLETLDLSYNHFYSLTRLRSLYYLPNLRHLRLFNNMMQYYPDSYYFQTNIRNLLNSRGPLFIHGREYKFSTDNKPVGNIKKWCPSITENESCVKKNCGLGLIPSSDKRLAYLTILHEQIAKEKVTNSVPSIEATSLSLKYLAAGLVNLAVLPNSIERLSLSYNPTMSIAVAGANTFEKVRRLSLKDCSLSNLDFISLFPHVRRLNISYNNIENLNALSGCAELEYLVANHNKLKDIRSLSALESLKFIHLNTNNLDYSALQSLVSLPALSYLDIQNNKVTDAEVSQLLYLNLRQPHHIQILNRAVISSQERTKVNKHFEGGISKEFLMQQLSDKQTSLADIELLDLNSYPISRFDDFSDNVLPNVQIADLSGCQIEYFRGFPSSLPGRLEQLYLANNRLTANSLLSPQQETLFVSDTLKVLDLSNNNLQIFNTECTRGLPNLEVLRLRNTGISIFSKTAFKQTPNLRELDLSGNQINQFPGGIFDGLKRLASLDLSDNKLTAFDFLGTCLFSMRSLNLESNRLFKLKNVCAGLLRLPNLHSISLANNTKITKADHFLDIMLFFCRKLQIINHREITEHERQCGKDFAASMADNVN